MSAVKENSSNFALSAMEKGLIIALCFLLSFPLDLFAQRPVPADSTVNLDAELAVRVEQTDSLPPTEVTADDYPYGLDGKIPFNPSPMRAVWMSALFPDWVRSTTAATGNSRS